ncbi:crotonase/enoyl-CoA hydratase family protein [Sphingobium sp. DEHP117]|uniref:crotonase/enoyl-CoA hydratase family protein n=1 Tax=Sphingobium sp. DEHP117 TaxID=2993436 RepID=UPI0027D6EB1A|nr:crotonase/enoyl-CoA hydratase family protein [Sphingobium sp. DEHP117]MDQ4421555.1 crotonase/enoyl-CoA hydratase family protein [Sphingobium sp. DEHP117]
MAGIDFTIADGIATIAINRPEARNAVNGEVARGIRAAVDEIESNDEIRVGILTGNGGTFCAGLDLKAFLNNEEVKWPGIGFAGLVERTLTKPMIAAVEGFALAGGFELALSCDLIIASREAKCGLPEVKRGLVARSGGLVRLPRQMPQRIAAELVLTGDMVSAERLAGYGLINRIVDAGTALAEAQAMARTIAANGPMALAASKKVLAEAPGWTLAEMFDRQHPICDPVFASQDAREGARAFAEKRAPVWQGR